MSCTQLTGNLNPGCPALKKVAGIDKRIYIGQVEDIDPAILTFGTAMDITAFNLLATKKLSKYIGRAKKHSTNGTLVVGENTNLITQAVNLVLYAQNGAERKSIDELYKSKGMFAIAETNAGQLEVYGISNNNVMTYDNFGLDASAGEYTSGVLPNDDNTYKVTISGDVPNMELLFIPASSLATNIAALDALSYP